MAKFKTLPRVRMRNGVHFSVDEAFLTKLKAAGFEQAKITALLAEFEAAFADEDKYLQLSQASEYTEELALADSKRGHLYILIKQSVASWILIGIEPQLTSAKAIKTLNDLYKIDINAQYDEETGRMTNWLGDALTDENKEHLNTLGLSKAATLMKENNDQVKQYLAKRAEERGSKVLGALKEARTKTDDLYADITAIIESCSVLMDDPTAYNTFISEWNTEIERVKQQLNRKNSSASTTTTE